MSIDLKNLAAAFALAAIAAGVVVYINNKSKPDSTAGKLLGKA